MMSDETIRKRRRELNLKRFPSEIWFERQLQGLRLFGYRRNVPLLRKYFGDFVYRSLKIVIEVDGPSHDCEKQKAYDDKRSGDLRKNGYRVFRVKWKDKQSSEQILEELKVLVTAKKRFTRSPKRLKLKIPPKKKKTRGSCVSKKVSRKMALEAQEQGLAKKWLEEKRLNESKAC